MCLLQEPKKRKGKGEEGCLPATCAVQTLETPLITICYATCAIGVFVTTVTTKNNFRECLSAVCVSETFAMTALCDAMVAVEGAAVWNVGAKTMKLKKTVERFRFPNCLYDHVIVEPIAFQVLELLYDSVSM